MHYLTTHIEFSAYHRLFNPEFSDEKNHEIYQECVRGHGHNYILEVTVHGQSRKDTGIVMDLKKLNHLLMTEIFPFVDHKSLNDDVPFLKNINPTAENISMAFWNIIQEKLRDAALYRIRLSESDRNIVEYFGHHSNR